MQAGFAMLEAGTIREKNVQGNLVKNLLDVMICTATFFFFGYGFAFGEDVGGFIGRRYASGERSPERCSPSN